MWWILPVAAFGAATAIYRYFDGEAKQARVRWQRKRAEVERSIEEHEANIKKHLAAAKRSHEFHVLTDMHFSCVRVADAAHALLRDARESLDVMGRMLRDAKSKRDEFEAEWRACGDAKRRAELKQELQLIAELRARVFPDKDAVKLERDRLLERVRSLNARTRELKELIGARCGARGREWYEQREQRARAREKKKVKKLRESSVRARA